MLGDGPYQAHQRACRGRSYAPHAAIHAPSAKLMSGESNIVEMLLQPPALLLLHLLLLLLLFLFCVWGLRS